MSGGKSAEKVSWSRMFLTDICCCSERLVDPLRAGCETQLLGGGFQAEPQKYRGNYTTISSFRLTAGQRSSFPQELPVRGLMVEKVPPVVLYSPVHRVT
ncbi:hypothetical protein GN956_G24176 [Arapaima gigas]